MTDQPIPSNDFELALRESLDAETAVIGDLIRGTIVAVHGDVALVDIAGKSEAVLPRDELEDLGTGDPVEVVVTGIGEEIRVSRRLALELQLKEKLADAVESGEAVEGKVVGRRKGGFDVTIAGVRGFCPMSQISDLRGEDLDSHLGQTYTFKVLEFDPDQRKLVVSRAALLREEKERLRADAWERLEPGAVVDGTVGSLTEFGAFVDIGGVDGLVHVTEIAHHRVNRPSDALAIGQPVTVKILDVDRAKNRISLSIKQLLANPWDGVDERYAPRTAFSGTVVRATDFGVFVELEPGLDGLVHVSQLQPGVELGSAELAVGATVQGWVRDVDPTNHRIGLTMRRLPDRDPWERIEMRYQEGQVVEGTVENGADFGVFVELEPGLSGLIPISELGVERGTDPRSVFQPGEKVKVKVMTLDPGRQRISLSVRAYQHEQERQEYAGHMSSGSAEPTMTGFGAQLQAALKGNKK
ncbi:MAG: S1 RNA-binding domain-containing protein [Thermoanaerobaculales bacterium]|jgi:small subunit ribosomal protein S1|nr:S1 RNA-binding domain-containing protein [Thermoanaerobaculales bacterium]